jgi:signal transduction histidine kinase
MKLKFRISILVAAIFGVFVLTFLFHQYIGVRGKRLFYIENRKGQDLIIEKVLQLNRIKYEQLINDNSGWDEMVEFARNPDLKWAKENVDFFVNSFKLSFVQVYNKQNLSIYQFGDSTLFRNYNGPNPEMIQSMFLDTTFVHYFQYCGNDLLEIFGATIVPASDSDTRHSLAQGYLFIGRKWNPEYLSEHNPTSNYQVELISGSDLSKFRTDQTKNYFYKNLYDQKGQIVANLVFSIKDLLKEELTHFLLISILVALGSIISIIIFLFYFQKIILKPLAQISTTLNSRDPEYINSIGNQTEEFAKLRDLILQYFRQEELMKTNNAELKANIATKDKLFSIIAHDLKNPIGNILIVSDLLANSVKSHDVEGSEEMISIIGSQAKDTLTLLETLFEWAKAQTGQINFSPEMLNLEAIVEHLFEIYETAAKIKGISLICELPSEISVLADENMLHAILRNLISNAIKFTSQGGSIHISAINKSDCTEISVADNGIGMDLDTQDSLFQIGANTPRYGTANEKGTGLGLIICKEFIEKHGAQIAITSEPGEGSRFVLKFPL